MSQDVVLQRNLRKLFEREGRNLTLLVKDTTPTYNTSSATITVSAATQVTVRGRLYRKKRKRSIVTNGEMTDAWLDTQMAVIEARELSAAPRQGDYIVDGSDRWSIVAVEPQRGAEIVLTYELELSQG